MSYRIILAEDHALVRQGIRRIIEDEQNLEVVQEAGDGLELLNALKTIPADLVVLDITMPVMSGIEVLREVKRTFPQVKVLVLTMHKKAEYLNDALSAGADGYLLKEDVARELLSAIDTIHRGEIYVSPLLTTELAHLYVRSRREGTLGHLEEPLTHREIEILTLIAEGKSSKEIAEQLFLSFRTVQNHRTKIMRKLNLRKSADLVKYAIRKGYFTPPP
ncbi:MAG: response regulator transcription factor [Deltaproteobacteria bacterium]|nr:response regulator transcription factor [Deltaproteobacteria bacterium]